MKKLFLLIIGFLIILSAYTQNERETTSVLFLGNSYTYYNDGVDQVFKEIASSMGDEVETLSNSPGGYWLEYHCTNTTTLDYIQAREWDYVILQEQSQKPAFSPSQVETETYPYAEILCDSIHNNSECSTPVFFMTWGRENGDADNCGFYPPICTYEGMQWRLRQSYVEMAELNNGIVSPVGMVWKSIRESNPDIDLYQGDESHPNDNGTYVAACTFYATIFHKSPVGAYYPTEVSAVNAEIIQNAAWNVVTDSLDTWLIDTTTLQVDFEPVFLTKNFTAYFENYTLNSDSCYWDFGDGNGEWQYPVGGYYDMVTHQYEIEDEYDICVKAFKGCENKQVCKIRYIWASEIFEYNTSDIYVYPNPVSNDIVYITNCDNQTYQLFSIDGKLIDSSKVENGAICIEQLSEGIYILKIKGKKIKLHVLN